MLFLVLAACVPVGTGTAASPSVQDGEVELTCPEVILENPDPQPRIIETDWYGPLENGVRLEIVCYSAEDTPDGRVVDYNGCCPEGWHVLGVDTHTDRVICEEGA